MSFKVIMSNNPHKKHKKQFLRQLMVRPQKQTLLINAFIREKIFWIILKEKHIIRKQGVFTRKIKRVAWINFGGSTFN